ncbi:hypothetical protein [Nitratireductor luteus]|uniref:hypothetical protein n=1 Tax=Nitratireductor luteus TaxID=2976980 RepID=UPI00223FA634|nr:hypothetical protein [Nitratireductor luteus]
MNDGGIWAEFTIRASATAFVVIFIAWMAVRVGPAMGGILVGLPIVLAPGFYFLLRDYNAEFVSQAAAGALFSLSATQVFLAAYVATSRKGALVAILCSVLAWAVVAIPLSLLSHDPLLGGLLFLLMTYAMHFLGRRLLSPAATKMAGINWNLLFARGVAAGLLVGVVTLLAGTLGSSFAGLLMAFPVGFSVVALSLHLDHGAVAAAQTMQAGIGGVPSLAVFTLALSLALHMMPPDAAFLAALLLSCLATALFTVLARRKQRRPAPAR